MHTKRCQTQEPGFPDIIERNCNARARELVELGITVERIAALCRYCTMIRDVWISDDGGDVDWDQNQIAYDSLTADMKRDYGPNWQEVRDWIDTTAQERAANELKLDMARDRAGGILLIRDECSLHQ